MAERVIHFEISADDAERASKFYEGVFGWEIPRIEGQKYWLMNSGDEKTQGINGGMYERKNVPVKNAFIVQVEDIDAVIEKITKNGGKIVIEKRGIPGVGFVAYFEDTEGNTFGVLQPPDESPAAVQDKNLNTSQES